MQSQSKALPLISWLALCLTASASASTQQIHCGAIFDAERAVLLGPHILSVTDGKFDRVEEVRHPTSVVRAGDIDLRQSTCLPGLIDMHVHLGMQSSPAAYSEGFRLNPEDYRVSFSRLCAQNP